MSPHRPFGRDYLELTLDLHADEQVDDHEIHEGYHPCGQEDGPVAVVQIVCRIQAQQCYVVVHKGVADVGSVNELESDQFGFQELWYVDDYREQHGWDDVDEKMKAGGSLLLAEEDRPHDGLVSLRGDAHDHERLETQQNVLQWMPEPGDQLDKLLIVQVHVQVECVEDENADKEDIDNGECEQTVVEVGLDPALELDKDCGQVSCDSNETNERQTDSLQEHLGPDT